MQSITTKELISFLKNCGDLKVYALEGSFFDSFAPEKLMDASLRYEIVGATEVEHDKEKLIVLHIKKILTTEESKVFTKKWEDINENHPDRIIHCGHKDLYLTAKEYAAAVLQEAKEKKYKIVRANQSEKKTKGFICFKTVDGVEIGYNMIWPEAEGDLDID